MSDAAGNLCNIPSNTPRPPFYTIMIMIHKCCKCSSHLHGICGEKYPEGDDDYKPALKNFPILYHFVQSWMPGFVSILCRFFLARTGTMKTHRNAYQVIIKRRIRTRLDLLSIPQSGGKNVKSFRWDHRLHGI